MNNIIYAAFFYAIFQVLAGYAAPRLSDTWFVILGTLSAVFFTLVFTSTQIFSSNGLGKITWSGALFIFFANAAITMFTLFLGRSFQQLDAKSVIPLVFGIALFTSTSVSFILNKTIPSYTQIVSLILISGGLLLLGFQTK
jgi:hypothetical protein